MLGNLFIMELTHEMISTRKMLERIPFDQFDWKPHDKSMMLGHLAKHIAELVGLIALIIDTPELNFATPKTEKTEINSTADLVALLDKNIATATAKLQSVSDESLRELWTLSNGDHTIFTLPRVGAIRTVVFSHLIHHRGQLSVYLRLLNISVPSIYGPSADEAN